MRIAHGYLHVSGTGPLQLLFQPHTDKRSKLFIRDRQTISHRLSID